MPISQPAKPDAPKVLAKKRDILEAASRVFRRKGVHGTSMRDIAAELEMTVGNLYYYFENRQELLAFCQQEGLSGLLDLARRVRDLDADPVEKLHRLISGHVVLLNEATPGSLAHLEVEGLEGEWRETILAQRSEYQSNLRELIQDGIRAGVLRPTDASLAALAILGAVNWTVKWFRPDGAQTAAEVGRELADLQLRSLLVPGVHPPSPTLKGYSLASS